MTKNINKNIAFFLIVMLCLSCDPPHSIEFINNADSELKVKFKIDTTITNNDLNYVENKKLINFDGELLRLSSKHGIPREEFIKFYVGNEINPNFESFLGENKKWHNFFTKEKK